MPNSIIAWAVTTGETGMRTQARGLAQAVADVVVEKTVGRRAPWRWWLGGPASDRFEPPWPDVLITCGRRSAKLSARLRRAGGERMLSVHIQDPRAAHGQFDLIIAMEHDAIAAGGNVIKASTALHDLTPENLAVGAEAWRERFVALGRPLAGVVIGGTTQRNPFTLAHGQALLAGLRRLRAAGVALAITPSRRTPPAVTALLGQAFAGDNGVFLWDLAGDNPYRAILSLSDRLVVTSDSVSMISEAIATPHPVEVFDLGFARYAPFLDRLVAEGLVRRFEGNPERPTTTGPVNATEAAAAAVTRLLQARTGVRG